MGWYLYGITPKEAAEDIPLGLSGLNGVEVFGYCSGKLCLVVSEYKCAMKEFQNLAPQDTLAAAQRHDEVLSAVASAAPVLPVRFGTVLTDSAAAEDLLQSRQETLMSVLTEVAGADEWVIQVDALPTAGDVGQTGARDLELTPGLAFFARKRAQREARALARERASTLARALEAQLTCLARGVRALPLREADTVARAAYLVGRKVRDDFLAVVTAGGDESVTIQGPLPPYRFVDKEVT
jgi:hypothetical protein